RGADCGQAAQSALQFSMNDGFGTLQSALTGFNLFTGNFVGIAVRLEFLQAGSDDFGEMALFVAFGYADSFVELAAAQRAGDRGSELPRLFTGGVESDPAIDHHADGPGGHDQQDDDDDAGQPSHLTPQGKGVPIDRFVLEQPKAEQLGFDENESC